MAAIWNSPWDTNNEWYNMMMASGQYWNDADLFHASQDRNFADAIFQAKSDYANATTDEGRALANANAEAARKNYNYTSGTAGAEYNPFGNGASTPGGSSSFWGGEMMSNYNNAKNYQPFSYQPYQSSSRVEDSRNALANYGSFSYAPYVSPVNLSGRISAIENVDPFKYEEFKAPDPFEYEKYENTTPDFQHSDAYTKAMGDVLGYGDFSYDYTTDPLYDVYKKEYTREGRRASEDALAQAAAMTGGVPSSYANTAAQQAGNYYASQIADKIPELRAQAYNEYQNKYNQLLSKYNVANTGDQFDYGIYKDKLNQDYQQYLDDLNMRYGMYRDNYNDLWNQYNTNRNFAYNQYSDDYNRAYQQWGDKTNLDYQNWRDNYNKLMDLYNMDFQQDQTAYGRYSDDYNRAYQGWKDDYNRLMDMYNIDVDADNTAYSRWANNRDFAYNQYRDDYNKALDMLDFSNNNYWKTHGEDLDAAAAEDAKRLDYAKMLAQFGDYSALDDYYGGNGGLTNAYANYLAEQSKGRGGGGAPRTTGNHVGLDTDRGKMIMHLVETDPSAVDEFIASDWNNMDAELKYLVLLETGMDTTTALHLSSAGSVADVSNALGRQYSANENSDGDIYSQLFANGAQSEADAYRYTGDKNVASTYAALLDENAFGNKDPEVNAYSVNNIANQLGMDDITPEQLAALVNQGSVKKYLSNGQWYFQLAGNPR